MRCLMRNRYLVKTSADLQQYEVDMKILIKIQKLDLVSLYKNSPKVFSLSKFLQQSLQICCNLQQKNDSNGSLLGSDTKLLVPNSLESVFLVKNLINKDINNQNTQIDLIKYGNYDSQIYLVHTSLALIVTNTFYIQLTNFGLMTIMTLNNIKRLKHDI